MKKNFIESAVVRQNVLNNTFAMDALQQTLSLDGVMFESKLTFIKRQVAEFFEVTERTIDYCIEKNEKEIAKNGYEVLRGKRLVDYKLAFQSRFGNEIDFVTKTTVLGIFDFRAFLNEEMNVRFSLLIVSIRFIVLACVLSSCSGNHSRMAAEVERLEKAAISDSTAVIDIAECRMKHFPLSRLIEEVEYVPLETSDSSVLYSVAQFKLTDSLIYVCDVMKQLKKFDRKGRYVGNAYTRGEGPEEVVQLYDFDVDEDYLYLLDGARSVVLRFTHQGEFVDRRGLPFRAICMKHLSDGRYLFRLAPFSLADEKEVSALLMLTDADFNPRREFFTQNRDVEGTTLREPYFESSSDSRYFAPLYRRSIYRLEGDSLVMDYYLNFGTPYYETNRRYKGAEEAKERGIYYTFPNPMHTERYLLQAFITSRAQQGLLVIDRQTKRAVFAEGLENDRDDMLGFNIWSGMQTYDAVTGRLAGIAESYYESSFSDEAELERIKSILPDSVVSVLLKKGNEELNPVLMFYRLREDIVK